MSLRGEVTCFTIKQLDSLHWFHNVVAQCHIFDVWTQGGYYPHIQTRSRFSYNAPILQASSSYVYSLGHYCVDKQTNKHIHKQRNRRRWKHPTFLATRRHWVNIVLHCTYMLDNNRLVIRTCFVDSAQHFVEMLCNVVFLIQQQRVEQLGWLAARWHDPVSKVSHDARQNLWEVVIHERTTAEVWPFN